MSYREWAPGTDLAGRVAAIWTSEAAEPGVRRVLPDGCMDIIWGPHGLQVAGADTTALVVPLRPGERFVAVRFLPGGAGGLFGVPADALRNARVPLGELWDRVPDGAPDLGRLRAELAVRLRATEPPDPAAPAMRRSLASGRPIAEVAADLGFSERQLRRRATAAFGYGPKVLQRVLRFQQALTLARGGADLAEVAAVTGHADQPHLAGEVKILAGVPITDLLTAS